MRSQSKRLIPATAAIIITGLVSAGQAAAQAGQAAANGQTAGEVFKNVTTSTLKGTTVGDFMGSMSVMSSALGFDCADCHVAAGTDKVDWAYDTTRKLIARRM